MNDFLGEAITKLDSKPEEIKGNKERAMASAIRETLKGFCEQNGEFAQAVAQGGSFADCLTSVAKGVGSSISDVDAYKKAVAFFFPGAQIRVYMEIDLVGESKPSAQAGIASTIIRLEDFL